MCRHGPEETDILLHHQIHKMATHASNQHHHHGPEETDILIYHQIHKMATHACNQQHHHHHVQQLEGAS